MCLNNTINRGLYQHYKGKYYQVIGLARHTENLEEFVVYQALYGDCELWVRPSSLFTETIIYNGIEMQRFKLINSGASHQVVDVKKC